jgi:hypothetical protein
VSFPLGRAGRPLDHGAILARFRESGAYLDAILEDIEGKGGKRVHVKAR